jgi:KaiC/GvpD/RAD55 family RecA-like ATPase
VDRVKTGIKGFDELVEGGFFPGSTVLISGGAGAGKTIFCAQFVLEGLKKGENCMFITLEQRPKDLIDDIRRFGWDLQKYIDEKKFYLVYQDPFQITDITSPLLDEIKTKNIQRVVIDSTAVFGMYYKDPFEIRKQLFKLLMGLKDIGVTSMLTSELTEDARSFARFGVEEFITDVLIILYNIRKENVRVRAVEILKSRGMSHETKLVPFEITKTGIVVHPEGKVYS